MNTVLLVHNSGGFSWEKSEKLFVKGYLSDRNGRFYENKQLLEYFSEIQSFSDLEERVRYANGCFSVIFWDKEELYAASDPIRAFPVFYKSVDGEWLVSDEPYRLVNNSDPNLINEAAWTEFMATGFVTGNETLINGIRQIQAGELVQFKKNEVKRKFYYTYRTPVTSNADYIQLRNEGIRVFNSTFKRFIDSLKDRTVVVPLSGGFDSRLIAVMLKKFGYTKVVCITYGRPDNPEIKVSKKVADILGFKWICIEHSDELINGFIEDPYFRRFYPYSSNFVSMFYLQEYFALRQLKDKKLIPDDSIFVPGHTGDFVGGRHLNKYVNLLESESNSEIAERIFFFLYNYLRPHGRNKDLILERIEKNLEEKFTGEHDLAYSIQEDWEYKEKLAKFIANSASTYTFFGYGFRLPYWDKELVDFFRTLPLHMKINKFLYDDILSNEYFEPAGVNFTEELQATEKIMKRQQIKNRIKYILPQFILRMFHSRQDNFYYYEITKELVNDAARKGKKIKVYNNSYNSLIIQWYLEEVKLMLRS
jgi:asparagine synthase (glutamine-hydrolysing)